MRKLLLLGLLATPVFAADTLIGNLVSAGATINNSTTVVPFTLSVRVTSGTSKISLSCSVAAHVRVGTANSVAALTTDSYVPISVQTDVYNLLALPYIAIIPDAGGACTCHVYEAPAEDVRTGVVSGGPAVFNSVTDTGLTTRGVVTNTAAGLLGTLPGTTTTVLHGNAAGLPAFGAVSLTADVIGTLPVANGGTGSATQNFVDLTTGQTIAGTKTFSTPIAVGSGGTGSATQNFVDLTTAQTVAGVKTFSVAPIPSGDGTVSFGSPSRRWLNIFGDTLSDNSSVARFNWAGSDNIYQGNAAGGGGEEAHRTGNSNGMTTGWIQTWYKDNFTTLIALMDFNGNLQLSGTNPVPVVHSAQTTSPVAIEYGRTAAAGTGILVKTFATAFASAPACTCADENAVPVDCGITVAPTGSGVTFAIVAARADTLDWYCVGAK